jgi:hypothetical protein
MRATAAEPALAEAAAVKKKTADNAACYVCHPSLKTEAITTTHLDENVGCVDCHGPSTEHLQDEMQMTTPDHLFGRLEVDGMCGKCHEDQHASVEDEVEVFRREWEGRARPNGRTISATSICTDCHGTHNIDTSPHGDNEADSVAWTNLFNGEDLDGFQTDGRAAWQVKRGHIVAAAGENGAGGTLWTDADYGNFLLVITFRTDWPSRAGVHLRYDGETPSPRVEIMESNTPRAYTGSVSLSGGNLVLVNSCKELFDPGGWNTISAKVQGDRFQVWLNGEEVGAVRARGPQRGRIGVTLDTGLSVSPPDFTIGEIRIQQLGNEVDANSESRNAG